MTKAIIFDFDGTIADSFGLFVETLRKLLRISTDFSSEDVNRLRGKRINEIKRELGIRWWQIPILLTKGRREARKNYGDVTIFEHIPDLLKQLASEDYTLFILSSNTSDVISTFLKKNRLESLFKNIYSEIGLTGKARLLRKLMRREGFLSTDSIYIGDEIRDIEAAHKAGIECISVAWGYSTPESLSAHNSDYLVSHPNEILQIIHSRKS